MSYILYAHKIAYSHGQTPANRIQLAIPRSSNIEEHVLLYSEIKSSPTQYF